MILLFGTPPIYLRRVYAGPFSLRYIFAGLRAMLDTSGRVCDPPSLYDHTDCIFLPTARVKVMFGLRLEVHDVRLAQAPRGRI